MNNSGYIYSKLPIPERYIIEADKQKLTVTAKVLDVKYAVATDLVCRNNALGVWEDSGYPSDYDYNKLNLDAKKVKKGATKSYTVSAKELQKAWDNCYCYYGEFATELHVPKDATVKITMKADSNVIGMLQVIPFDDL